MIVGSTAGCGHVVGAAGLRSLVGVWHRSRAAGEISLRQARYLAVGEEFARLLAEKPGLLKFLDAGGNHADAVFILLYFLGHADEPSAGFTRNPVGKEKREHPD